MSIGGPHEVLPSHGVAGEEQRVHGDERPVDARAR